MSDQVKLSGEETFASNPEIYDTKEIETIRNKISLINSGYVVHVRDAKSCDEKGSFLSIKTVLYSTVNGMPVWGDVTLKISKQAAQKLKTMLSIESDAFDETVVPIKGNKKQAYF